MKKTRRKWFNFYRSYYDIYNELPTDKDKVAFMDALLARQFQWTKPELTGVAKLAYMGVMHSVDKQVTGYEKASGDKLGVSEGDPQGPPQGSTQGPPQEVQEEEKEKEKEEYTIQDTNVSTAIAETKPEEFWKPDINALISILKETATKHNIAYDTTQERNFARHILTAKEFGKQAASVWMTPTQYSIAVLEASIAIGFWKWIASWPKKIYQWHSDIYNEFLKQKPKKKERKSYTTY